MPKSLTLELITPEKTALSASADFVVLPAREGEMGVLPGHRDYLVELNEGEVRVTHGGEEKVFAISGGFAEIKGDKVSLFAETAEMAGAIDAERAHQALEQAKAVREKKDIDPMTLAGAEASIRRAQARIKIAQRRSG